jgi:protein-disulfide isomerase
MKIEVLYVSECPYHSAAVRLVKEVLESHGVTAKVDEVLVTDEKMAAELGFHGSPTIRINGQDVAGEALKPEAFALSCRLYPESKYTGLPPAELVRRAVDQARAEARG